MIYHIHEPLTHLSFSEKERKQRDKFRQKIIHNFLIIIRYIETTWIARRSIDEL